MPKKRKTRQPFENNKIRAAWNEEEREWYFSVVDIIKATLGDPNPCNYWNEILKPRLRQEKCSVVENCNQLKTQAEDGKFYKTDVASTEQLLRMIQSVPSPKAEPFKLWLAMVGAERMKEAIALELTISRALTTYLKEGHNGELIIKKVQKMQKDQELPLERQAKDQKPGLKYALLSNEIARACLSAEEHKKCKSLRKDNQSGNMKTLDKLLSKLSETTMTTLSRRLTYNNVLQILNRDANINSGADERPEEIGGEKSPITHEGVVDFTKVLGAIIDSVDEDKKNKKSQKARR
ncbi:MAG: Bro-N domain-containing protein [Candidatus Margulisbacteria bacterium]|jgi:hypothetical protein|nr:Bro-N domain-containing protein [Candidatus Margulisiibacteriota bacterium]